MYKVSILIATYNQEGYIKEAVELALSQDYANIEVIVSDDCSTDKTIEVLANIKDPRLKVYRNEKNIGRIQNHRKLLYELASGDLVAFLDGDDFYVDKSFISRAVKLFEKDKEIVSVIGGYKDVFYNGEEKIFNYEKEDIVNGLDIFFGKYRVMYAHGSWIYRRNLIEKCNFFTGNVKIGDDLEGWYESLFFGKVGILPIIAFAHRIHFDNGVVKVNPDLLLEDLFLYDVVADFGKSLGFDKNLMERWRIYNTLKKAESFVSWSISLYRRKIYTKEFLYDLIESFIDKFRQKYGMNFIFKKNPKLLRLELNLKRIKHRL